MSGGFSLVPIERDGAVRDHEGELPEITAGVLIATVKLYDLVGFEEPWVCYLALEGSTAVGTCGFKSPPRDGRVEIAYFTFPDHEGRGVATTMASELIAVARRRDPTVSVAAQTLPERNASHRVLEKLGFVCAATIDDPEDGTVLEWRLVRTVAINSRATKP